MGWRTWGRKLPPSPHKHSQKKPTRNLVWLYSWGGIGAEAGKWKRLQHMQGHLNSMVKRKYGDATYTVLRFANNDTPLCIEDCLALMNAKKKPEN